MHVCWCYNYFYILLEFVDFNFTSDNVPIFVLRKFGGRLHLSPIYFPIGFAFNDKFLEDKETFTVFLLTELNYELDPARDRAIVTIFDTTCKNLFEHICICT